MFMVRRTGSSAGRFPRLPRAFLVAAAALAALAVVPVASAGSAADPEVVDPEGDAREWNHDVARPIVTWRGCGLLPTFKEACEGAAHDAYGLVDPYNNTGDLQGGVPAAPSMDGIAAWIEETPTELVATLQLASLDETFEGAISADDTGSQDVAYEVEWQWGKWGSKWGGDRICRGFFRLDVQLAEEGKPGFLSTYHQLSPYCPPGTSPSEPPEWCSVWECMWSVPFEIRYGTPATITWRVAREVLADDDAGIALEQPYFGIFRREQRSPIGGAYYGLGTPGGQVYQGSGGTYVRYIVDRSVTGNVFVFALPAPANSTPTSGPVRTIDPIDSANPTIDITAASIDDDPRHLTFELELARVDPEPTNVSIWGQFTTTSGIIHEIYLDGQNGVWSAASDYTVEDPQQPLNPRVLDVPVQLEVTPGSPGTLRLVFERADLAPYHRGDLYRAIEFWSSDTPGHVVPAPFPTGGYGAAVLTPESVRGDVLVMSPVRARADTPDAIAGGRQLFEDDVGDARLPDGITGLANPAQFDISYFTARAQKEGEVELSIGIQELGGLATPPLYDAVFYALGAETSTSRTMVGFYKHRDSPTGIFFCAPDVSVLDGANGDPTGSIWTPITGTVRATRGSGANGPGVIAFTVPTECLTAAADEDIVIERLEAAAFIVSNPSEEPGAGTLHRADEGAAEGPVTLLRPQNADAALARPWYEAPMGIEHFWDILGVAAATVVGAGGLVVRLRHRRADAVALANGRAAEARETYRAALARALASSTGRDVYDDNVLRALRERFGISEREHAAMELEVRAGSGAAAPLLPGQLFLGKYRIARVLGEGGFARTFLARDERLDREVVLKVARWDTPHEGKRALREARALARLRHERIVAIHDAEEVGGSVVLVLEYMRAGSLQDRLERGALAREEALAIADDVLAALEAAHEAGVVHRDVKPANVLLDINGRAKLADFGIARPPAGSGTASGISLDGAGAGTLAYMSPEQARGVEADERSDLYAAGALLYEMIVRRTYLDFRRTEFEVRRSIVEDPPDLPLPGVAPSLNALLAASLAKDPAKRPQTAGQMRRLLRAESER